MSDAIIDNPWLEVRLPPNAHIGRNTIISGQDSFKRFSSQKEDGLTVGDHSTMDGVQFAIGESGHILIGHYCYFTNAVLLCELELRIGNYVIIGWNTTISDSDFHPIQPAQRIIDAMACSPVAKAQVRPPLKQEPVIIEDDVWIGPSVTILKGITIGAGAFIEPGSVVTRDVAAKSRVIGNPARIVSNED
ncbi:MAG: acyltransferase [Nitrospirales bacterium]